MTRILLFDKRCDLRHHLQPWIIINRVSFGARLKKNYAVYTTDSWFVSARVAHRIIKIIAEVSVIAKHYQSPLS